MLSGIAACALVVPSAGHGVPSPAVNSAGVGISVADIAAVVDNCTVALQEAEEMAGFQPTQVVIGIAGALVKAVEGVIAAQ